jgi:hypothetical protein
VEAGFIHNKAPMAIALFKEGTEDMLCGTVISHPESGHFKTRQMVNTEILKNGLKTNQIILHSDKTNITNFCTNNMC